MKYIIPQEKIENLVFRYLDLQYGDLEKYKPKYYEGIILKKPNSDSEYGIIGWREHGEYSRDSVIYIDDNFTDNIRTFFNLDFPDHIDIIAKWIHLRYNLESEHINYTFGSVRNLLKIDTN